VGTLAGLRAGLSKQGQPDIPAEVCYKGRMSRPKKAETSKLPPLSQPTKDALLGERLLRAAKLVRSGATVPALDQIRWSNAVRDGLDAWLRTGEFDPLLRLLETEPETLSHPGIAMLTKRLLRLSRKVEEEELVGGGLQLHDEAAPLPWGTCKAAAQVLEQLASAVVSGLFQKPGWRVVPPVKRGRPGRTLSEISEASMILGDYEELLEYLRERKQDLKRAKGESKDRWETRLAQLIRRAWTESGIGIEGRTVPSEPVSARVQDQADPFDIFGNDVIEHVPLPLPDEEAENCARAAAGERSASLDHIAYFLVGYLWKKEPRTIRHYVEIARK